MKRILALVALATLVISSYSCESGSWNKVVEEFGQQLGKTSLDESTVIAGLKEALSVGTNRAVASVAKLDGYFGNPDIRILMPKKLNNVADSLKRIGLQRQVDDFVLSMNRAAERAAPKAKSYFVGAIKAMTFTDARNILYGEETAATEYFKTKTYEQLYSEFKPIVSASTNKVGVTRYYKAMMQTYAALPFVKAESFDLDGYVTEKSLAGLFYTVGQEEKKIRTDPAARATELLKRVFGSTGTG